LLKHFHISSHFSDLLFPKKRFEEFSFLKHKGKSNKMVQRFPMESIA